VVKSPTDVLVIAWPSGHHRPEQQSASWARDKYLWKSVENFHIYLHSFTIRVSDEKDIECEISCRIKHFHPSRDGGTGRRSGLKIRRPSGLGGSTPPPGTIAQPTWNHPVEPACALTGFPSESTRFGPPESRVLCSWRCRSSCALYPRIVEIRAIRREPISRKILSQSLPARITELGVWTAPR
jgi:hypothetical protein